MHERSGVGGSLFICEFIDPLVLVFSGIFHDIAADLVLGESDNGGCHTMGNTGGGDDEAQGSIIGTFVRGPRRRGGRWRDPMGTMDPDAEVHSCVLAFGR